MNMLELTVLLTKKKRARRHLMSVSSLFTVFLLLAVLAVFTRLHTQSRLLLHSQQ